MKTVFSSHNECAHIWVSQSQYEGRGSRVFFEGDTIYSYGRHFPVARFAPEFGDIVLFTNRGYSSSTGKHKSLIRAAIPSKYAVIYCDDPSRPASHNLPIWERQAARLRADFAIKTRKPTRANIAAEIYQAVESAANYCMALNIAVPEWAGLTVAENEAIEYGREAARARALNADALRNKREELAALDSIERLQQWENGLAHGSTNGFQYHPTVLRIKGEEIQTSRGARIPTSDAVKIYPLLDRVKRSGKTLEAGLHNINLGAYRFNSFDGNTLVVGCHSIAWDQIEKMAIQLNLREGKK